MSNFGLSLTSVKQHTTPGYVQKDLVEQNNIAQIYQQPKWFVKCMKHQGTVDYALFKHQDFLIYVMGQITYLSCDFYLILNCL